MPITQKHGHKLGEEVKSPAYVDANFLVYYSVGSYQVPGFQTVARNVMGDLLAQGVSILVSLVSVEEAWWATLEELFCRYIWQPPPTGEQCYLNRPKARSNWNQLMLYRSEVEKIVENLQELRNHGADIRFVPGVGEAFEVCHNAPNLMEKHSLFSADALHLSLALSQAKTLITFDVGDFKTVVDPDQDLTIILLTS